MAATIDRSNGVDVVNSLAFDFSGVSVLVTGGTSGIGHATARAFADAGAGVMVTGTRPAASEYDVDLSPFDYRQFQASDPGSVDRLLAEVQGLDVLVNNAGANFPGGRDEWEPDAFADSLELNLGSAMRLTVGCRSRLRDSSMAGGASGVNLASMSAFRSVPMVPGYGSAKAGLVALTRNLARAWAADGVRVNAVAPGVIETPMTAPLEHLPELRNAELAHIPLGRFGSAQEVADAILFLSTSAASYVTGATFAVDGGYLLV